MRRISWLITIASVLGLPLLAAYWVSGEVGFLLAFPPEWGRVVHVPFNSKWTLLCILFVSGLPFLWYLTRRRDRIFRHSLVLQRRHFPKWGYLGYLLLAISWLVAWNRFELLSVFQAYTFTPLWLGFILVVNADIHRRSNKAPLYKSPGKFGFLFILSAIFWWVFEYLNRFSENWIYLGVENVSAAHYYIHGSLCFSTVLPAVYSVFRWLNCFNSLHRVFYLGPRVPFLKFQSFGILSLGLGLIGMVGVALLPPIAYPFVWLGPVLIYGGIRLTLKQGAALSLWARGDWRWVAFWAFSGLICGFLWECWNINSLLKWEYRLSFFNGWQIFEMPVLGYLGYLPFGVFCGLISQLIFKNRASIEFSPND